MQDRPDVRLAEAREPRDGTVGGARPVLQGQELALPLGQSGRRARRAADAPPRAWPPSPASPRRERPRPRAGRRGAAGGGGRSPCSARWRRARSRRRPGRDGTGRGPSRPSRTWPRQGPRPSAGRTRGSGSSCRRAGAPRGRPRPSRPRRPPPPGRATRGCARRPCHLDIRSAREGITAAPTPRGAGKRSRDWSEAVQFPGARMSGRQPEPRCTDEAKTPPRRGRRPSARALPRRGGRGGPRHRVPEVRARQRPHARSSTRTTRRPSSAVNVWYHVGSKNEKPGKTGFAHLFEHLMFNGSENFNDDYFKVARAARRDRPQRHDQQGPHQLLPERADDGARHRAVAGVRPHGPPRWARSTRRRLDEQRGVVQNEKRQGENEPYATRRGADPEGRAYPKGHPYSWTVIGSMEDLNAASLDDVKEWFQTLLRRRERRPRRRRRRRRPRTSKAKVEKYFGDIPPGPPVAKHDAWVAQAHRASTARRCRTASRRRASTRSGTRPQWGAADDDRLDLVARVLASGKTLAPLQAARLRRPDRDRRRRLPGLVARSRACSWSRPTAKPGRRPREGREGGRRGARAARPRTARRPTSSSGRRPSASPASSAASSGSAASAASPTCSRRARSAAAGPTPTSTRLDRVKAATPADVGGAAKRWLSDGVYVLEVAPVPRAHGGDGGRRPQEAGPSAGRRRRPPARVPEGDAVERAEARRAPSATRCRSSTSSLLVDAGYAADQSAAPGDRAASRVTCWTRAPRPGRRSRSATSCSGSGAQLGTGVRPRHHVGDALRAEGEPRPVARRSSPTWC